MIEIGGNTIADGAGRVARFTAGLGRCFLSETAVEHLGVRQPIGLWQVYENFAISLDPLGRRRADRTTVDWDTS